jgi:putative two-component system response regulator
MESERATVMVVDDNLANLMVAKLALTHCYDVFTVPSAAKMFDMLGRNRPDLILLDIEMPETDGMEALSTLKANPDTANIPVIFLTAKGDPESELRGLALGALDYISKPFMPQLLFKRVDLHLTLESQRLRLEEQAKKLEASVEKIQNFNENLQQMVESKTHEILKLQNAILHGVADMVESRDDATGGHIERTQSYLMELINGLSKLGLYQEDMIGWDIELMLESSQLHDVGKIAISDSILKKPGRLTRQEFMEMKKHVEFGVKIIERIESEVSGTDFLRYAKIFAAYHHEKWDGNGYPNGLVGKDIPLPGRLMALADVYDALTSKRPYKDAYSHEEAASIIRAGNGSHFDPVLVDAFEQVADQFAAIASASTNQ